MILLPTNWENTRKLKFFENIQEKVETAFNYNLVEAEPLMVEFAIRVNGFPLT